MASVRTDITGTQKPIRRELALQRDVPTVDARNLELINGIERGNGYGRRERCIRRQRARERERIRYAQIGVAEWASRLRQREADVEGSELGRVCHAGWNTGV